MASKTTKKANAAAQRQSAADRIAEREAKNDVTRWAVMRGGYPVYGHNGGVNRVEAERLEVGLLEPAELVQIS